MVKSIKLKAYAKVNLCLDIIGKREDGYHLIETVMQSVGVFDKVYVKRTNDGKISVLCDKGDIPEKNNTAYKAAKAFFEHIGAERDSGAKIKIKKNIPSQAGMGGASADAAAVIVALNILYKTGLSKNELCAIGAKVGADVPFCIYGGTCLARGIGEVLTELNDFSGKYLVIAKGNEGVSTKEAYDAVDSKKDIVKPRLDKVIDAITAQNVSALKGNLINVFEQVVDLSDAPKIAEKMRVNGAIDSAMTGSGSAVFGVFAELKSAKKCAKKLKKEYPFAAACKTVNCGVSRI